MNPDPSRAEALFLAAVEIAEPQERADFLDRECGVDLTLRARVDALLASHGEAGEFLQTSPPSPELEAEFARLKPEEAGELIGPYRLMEQIGQGGFGTVWVADQEKPVRRRVALKIIKLGMDTREVIARFEQERQALAMMDHPHIAKVLDAGATQWGRPFFVMELVRGIKITEYCDQANLPTAERLALFIQVCHAVQHAHQKGIIHRDLKPSNILVTLHDGVPVPKVIDFGVAKATQQQRLTDLTIYTQFQQMIGTPLYMSPEQAEMSGLDIDTRSDIYSLGVLLYELLTGRTPFDPEDLMKQGLDEIRRTIREQEPPTPSMFLKAMADETRAAVAQHRQSDPVRLTNLVRGDLDWIVMKALEKDRSRRYETANGFARDIERHLASEPVRARPAGHLYRFRRLVKRNKLAFAAAFLVAASMLAGLGFSTWSYLREQEQRQLAEGERRIATEQRRIAAVNAAQAIQGEARARSLAYAARIQAAHFFLEAKQYTRVTGMLQQDVPKPGEKDLRGVEWRYLWRCIHATARESAARVTRLPDGTAENSLGDWPLAAGESVLSFTKDSASLWTITEGGEARRWNIADGTMARTSQIAEVAQRKWVVKGGDAILYGTISGELTARDLETGGSSAVKVTDGAFIPLSVSTDGRFAALATEREQLLIWDLREGKRIAEIEEFPSGGAEIGATVAFSHESELLAFARKGNILEISRTSRKGAVVRFGKRSPEPPAEGLVLRSGKGPAVLSSLAFSPNQRVLATGSATGGVELFTLPEFRGEGLYVFGNAELPTFSGHLGAVSQLQFAPDGRTLITTAADGVRFWSIATGQELMALPTVATLLVSPNGKIMAWHHARQTPGRVRLLQLPTLQEIDAVDWMIPPPPQPRATQSIRG